MIRSFLPIDLVDILLQSNSLSNKAKTRESLGGRESRFGGLAQLMGQWFSPRARSFTWVCTEGLSLHGLASVRVCSTNQAWEVDRLLVHEGDRQSCLALLENIGRLGNDLEIRRIFLRLAFGSPLLDSAVEAGFAPYKTERVYLRDSDRTPPRATELEMSSVPRRKNAADEYRVFELYQSCTPAQVRRVEGLTFAEWRGGRTRHAGTEWVFEKDGALVGWLLARAKRDFGCFELMAKPSNEAGSIVDYGLLHLGDRRNLLCLVPEYDPGQFRVLEDRGFSEHSRYCTMAREFTAKVQEPCLMPAGA